MIRPSMPSERYTPPPFAGRAGQPAMPVVPWREPPVMDVFERDGAYVGRLALPAGVFPRFASGDTMLAVYRDADGVNFVRKYRMVWR